MSELRETFAPSGLNLKAFISKHYSWQSSSTFSHCIIL